MSLNTYTVLKLILGFYFETGINGLPVEYQALSLDESCEMVITGGCTISAVSVVPTRTSSQLTFTSNQRDKALQRAISLYSVL